MDTVINGPNWRVGAPADPNGAVTANLQQGSARTPTLQKRNVDKRSGPGTEPALGQNAREASWIR